MKAVILNLHYSIFSVRYSIFKLLTGTHAVILNELITNCRCVDFKRLKTCLLNEGPVQLLSRV